VLMCCQFDLASVRLQQSESDEGIYSERERERKRSERYRQMSILWVWGRVRE